MKKIRKVIYFTIIGIIILLAAIKLYSYAAQASTLQGYADLEVDTFMSFNAESEVGTQVTDNSTFKKGRLWCTNVEHDPHATSRMKLQSVVDINKSGNAPGHGESTSSISAYDDKTKNDKKMAALAYLAYRGTIYNAGLCQHNQYTKIQCLMWHKWGYFKNVLKDLGVTVAGPDDIDSINGYDYSSWAQDTSASAENYATFISNDKFYGNGKGIKVLSTPTTTANIEEKSGKYILGPYKLQNYVSSYGNLTFSSGTPCKADGTAKTVSNDSNFYLKFDSVPNEITATYTYYTYKARILYFAIASSQQYMAVAGERILKTEKVKLPVAGLSPDLSLEKYIIGVDDPETLLPIANPKTPKIYNESGIGPIKGDETKEEDRKGNGVYYSDRARNRNGTYKQNHRVYCQINDLITYRISVTNNSDTAINGKNVRLYDRASEGLLIPEGYTTGQIVKVTGTSNYTINLSTHTDGEGTTRTQMEAFFSIGAKKTIYFDMTLKAGVYFLGDGLYTGGNAGVNTAYEELTASSTLTDKSEFEDDKDRDFVLLHKYNLASFKNIISINDKAYDDAKSASVTTGDKVIYRVTVHNSGGRFNGKTCWDGVKIGSRLWKWDNDCYISDIASKNLKFISAKDQSGNSISFNRREYSSNSYEYYTDALKNVVLETGGTYYVDLEFEVTETGTFKPLENIVIKPPYYETGEDNSSHTDVTTDYINMSGKVWIDQKENKANEGNQVLDSEDRNLEGIKVTLYHRDGTIVQNPTNDSHQIQNPTVTAADGSYSFNNIWIKETKIYSGITGEKWKKEYDGNGVLTKTTKVPISTSASTNINSNYRDYYVVFSYNGQEYIQVPTTGNEPNQSKAKEIDRPGYNARFTEIKKGTSETANKKMIYKYAKDNATKDPLKGAEIQYREDSNKLDYIKSGSNIISNIYDGETGRTDKANYVINATTNGTYSINVTENTQKNTYEEKINYGVLERNNFDLMLRKDLYNAEVKINGKSEVYKYNKRKEEDMSLDLRGSDLYILGLHDSDIQHTGSNALEVYTTYRILVYNQSSYVGSATRIADYFDSNKLQFVEAYLGDDNGNKTGNISVSGITNGVSLDFSSNEQKLANNEHMNIYIKFKIKPDVIKSNVTKDKELDIENYSEIVSYKSYYEDGKIAGKIDKDSEPGNFNYTVAKAANLKAKYEEFYSKLTVENVNELTEEFQKELIKIFEDDADRAPGLKITLVDERTLSGTVFEDSTTVNASRQRLGDGLLKDGENKVANVDIKLLDKSGNIAKIYDEDSKTWKEAITKSDSNGNYNFSGYLPGEYKIEYVYGKDNSSGVVRYNGQDYKSTIDTMKKEDRENNYWYTIAVENRYSDAKDDKTRRENVNEYSKIITNHLGNELVKRNSSEFIDNTWMVAYTEKLDLEVEYARKESETSKVNKAYTTDTTYKIDNVDFGVAERARAELTIDKEVANVKLVTQDGQVLADAKQKADNLAWVKSKKTGENVKQYGFIQAIVDENLLEGTTLQVTYKFTIENTGELDYNTDDYYNYGTPGNDSQKVRTEAQYIVDYVDNSIGFDKDAQGNNIWGETTKQELADNKLVSTDINLSTNRIILKSSAGNRLLEKLVPGEKREVELILSTVIGKDEVGDDLSYINKTEILQTSNTVGRRSYNTADKNLTSIPGNFNPNETDDSLSNIKEPDADKSENITIIPPYGQDNSVIYYCIGAASVLILGVGIFLIKKYVLGKNK